MTIINVLLYIGILYLIYKNQGSYLDNYVALADKVLKATVPVEKSKAILLADELITKSAKRLFVQNIILALVYTAIISLGFIPGDQSYIIVVLVGLGLFLSNRQRNQFKAAERICSGNN